MKTTVILRRWNRTIFITWRYSTHPYKIIVKAHLCGSRIRKNGKRISIAQLLVVHIRLKEWPKLNAVVSFFLKVHEALLMAYGLCIFQSLTNPTKNGHKKIKYRRKEVKGFYRLKALSYLIWLQWRQVLIGVALKQITVVIQMARLHC